MWTSSWADWNSCLRTSSKGCFGFCQVYKNIQICVSWELTAGFACLRNEMKIYFLSSEREKEREDEEEEMGRRKEADDAWEKTISSMRAKIAREPLTTSCLGVTGQPHLSVCVPGWTDPGVSGFERERARAAPVPARAQPGGCRLAHSLTNEFYSVCALDRAFGLPSVSKLGFICRADKVSKQWPRSSFLWHAGW